MQPDCQTGGRPGPQPRRLLELDLNMDTILMDGPRPTGMPLEEKEITIAYRRESLTTHGPWLCHSRREGETAYGLKEEGRCDLQIA
jgi:hypothetical protein